MLALIAGQGQLPVILANRCAESGQPLQVCELEGFPSDLTYVTGVTRFRIEQLGSFFSELKRKKVTDVVFAGAVRRPRLDPSAIDAATQPFVPRMLQAIKSGDDGALRIVLKLFEEQGFRITAAHEVMPELLPDAGQIGARTPTEAEMRDAARGFEVLGALSAADIGQGCVVAGSQVMAVEAAPGTNWMLDSLRALGRPDGLPGGGVFVKAPKHGQDRRIDLPVIGPETISAAISAGLTGIAIAEGGVMVLDFETCRRRADEANLALWVRSAA